MLYSDIEKKEKNIEFERGDHVCLLYESEQEWANMVKYFISDGFESRDKVVYITMEHEKDDFVEGLKEREFYLQSYIDKGQLVILSVEEFYLTGGVFDTERIADFISSEIEVARSEGYRCLRITGEMEWVRDYFTEFDEFIEYETNVNNVIKNADCIALCQYKMDDFSSGILLDILRIHPKVILDNDIYENFYYINPGDFIGNLRQDVEIEKWISNLKQQKKTYRALKKSEEKYRDLVEKAGVAILIDTVDGRFKYYNTRFADLFGYSMDEMKRMNIYSLIHPDDIEMVRKIHRNRVTNKKAPLFYEFRGVKKDGSTIYLEVHASPFIENGKIKGTRSYIWDITERKEKNQELLIKDTAIRSSMSAFLVCDLDGKIIMVNPYFAELWGYENEEDVIGISATNLLVDVRKFKEVISIIKEKGKWKGELIAKKKDGSRTFSVDVFTNIILDAEENPVYIAVSFIDISQRKKAEQALRESEERFRNVFNNAPIGIYRTTPDGQILMANNAVVKMLGYSSFDELIEIDVGAYYGSGFSRDEFKRRIEDEGSIIGQESIWLKKDGTKIFVRENAVCVRDKKGKVLYYEGTIEDITEKKRMEKLIKDSEEMYRSIYDATIALAEKTKLDVTIKTIADRATKLLNGKDVAIYELDHERKVLVPIFSNDRDFKEEIISYEIPLGQGLSGRVAESGKGDIINIGCEEDYSLHIPGTDLEEDENESVLSVPMFDGDKVIGVITLNKLHDIFEKTDVEKLTIFARLAELAIKSAHNVKTLSESEEKYRTLVEESHDAIYIYKVDVILFANERAYKMTGYNREELLNMSILDLLHSEDKDNVKDEAFPDIRKKGGSNRFEVRILRKNGEVRYGEFAVNPISYAGDSVFLGMVRDITEFREMETELAKSQRLESLGVLAGGIAHDFNNLLTGIMGNISLMQMKVDGSYSEKMIELLRETEDAANRATKLTQQLLTFSKGGSPIRETASIAEIIRDSARFALRGSNVKCNYNFPDDLRMVNVDRDQISQVINNIIINADQAMPEGGVINISAENTELSKEEIIHLKKGRYVKIAIEDEGIGISKKYLPKIFDPYFSTKQKGSGLGLSIVYSILQKHEGYITVDSEYNLGSTFYIYLPVAEEKGEVEKDKTIEQELTGEGRILLMDDEKLIRNVTKKMLEKLGYEVECSSSGEETIERYREAINKGKNFNAVIMDLTIPGGMGGKEAIRQLLETDPEAKVIVSSGYSNDPVMANYEKYGFSGVCPKPYRLEVMGRVLNDILKEHK